MGRIAGFAALITLTLLTAQLLSAGGIELTLESPTGEPIELSAGSPVAVATRALYTLVLTIPVTSAFRLTADVRVDGRPWDNETVRPFQPMSRLIWREDEERFALVATGIFRATEAGTYRVVVIYGDETMDAPLSTVLEIAAR